MKNGVIGVGMIVGLLLMILPAMEAEAARPISCSYQAVVTATHETCGVVANLVYGVDLASCQVSVADHINLLNTDPAWTNPVVTTACHAVGALCPVKGPDATE